MSVTLRLTATRIGGHVQPPARAAYAVVVAGESGVAHAPLASVETVSVNWLGASAGSAPVAQLWLRMLTWMSRLRGDTVPVRPVLAPYTIACGAASMVTTALVAAPAVADGIASAARIVRTIACRMSPPSFVVRCVVPRTRRRPTRSGRFLHFPYDRTKGDGGGEGTTPCYSRREGCRRGRGGEGGPSSPLPVHPGR